MIYRDYFDLFPTLDENNRIDAKFFTVGHRFDHLQTDFGYVQATVTDVQQIPVKPEMEFLCERTRVIFEFEWPANIPIPKDWDEVQKEIDADLQDPYRLDGSEYVYPSFVL